MRNLITFIITLLGCAAAASTNQEVNEISISKATNFSQTFHLQMKVTHGNRKYNNFVLQTHHVGAALSVTVFRNSSEDTGATLLLNNTQLQVDGLNFPFSMNTYDMIAGHSRWSEVTFEIGDGTEGFVHQGSSGIVVNRSGFDGWLVCEWSLGFNIPQLFEMIRTDDSGPGYGPYDIPSSCARVLLMPHYI